MISCTVSLGGPLYYMAVVMGISRYIGVPGCSFGLRMRCFGRAARVDHDDGHSPF